MSQRPTSEGPQTLDASRSVIETHAHSAALAATIAAASNAPMVDAASPQLDAGEWPERYALRKMLGEGGMGEVRLYGDARIGRDVAVKNLRPEHAQRADSNARFLREARVQGQLEHPSIVPVYDLGRQPDGSVYFSMKRVQGRTLEDVLRGLRDQDPETVEQYSQRRLLSAFSTVCLAVHYAHTRGVIHRDLKPGNIMLGAFGEVYVLDWGLARLSDAPDEDRTEPLDMGAIASGRTAQGSMLGTPGYMAPEQMRNAGGVMDARADVYALGTILFEILAGEPMHGDATIGEIVMATLTSGGARPTSRVPEHEVPPELAELCVAATALEPADRPASARELNVAIERFLDGDRDTARRRQLAVEHAAAARKLALDEGASTEATRDAMAEVGRALAFDPDNVEARATLVQLLTQPPRELPQETRDEIVGHQREELRIVHLYGGLASLMFWLMVPLMMWMGIRQYGWLGLCGAAFTATAVHALGVWRKPPADGKMPLRSIVLGLFQAALSSVMLSPFVIAPIALATSAMGCALSDDHRNARRIAVVACAAFMSPLILEWLHVLPPSYEITAAGIRLLPRMLEFKPLATLAVLVVLPMIQMVFALEMVGRFRRSLSEAQTKLRVMAWQLRQLTPARAAASKGTPATA